MPIPVTVIGGYLGTGKTTLVNHLLRNANGRRLAVLVNEFGELPIDADLIEAEDDEIISLAGGCVCCSYGDDLISAMIDISNLENRPDHILLEASGVAMPSAIVSSISLLNQFSMDSVIVLADAETVRNRASDKYMGDTILRQFDHADIVLLNKVDIVSQAELTVLRNWINAISPRAVLLEAIQAKIPINVALQSFERIKSSIPDNRFFHDNQYKSHELKGLEPTDLDELVNKLISDFPNLVRAKGFLKDQNATLKTLQIVGKRYEISEAPAGATEGLVLIYSKE